jgi:hypothetical protein
MLSLLAELSPELFFATICFLLLYIIADQKPFKLPSAFADMPYREKIKYFLYVGLATGPFMGAYSVPLPSIYLYGEKIKARNQFMAMVRCIRGGDSSGTEALFCGYAKI